MKNNSVLLGMTLLTSILGLAGCSTNTSSGNPPSQTNVLPKTSIAPTAKELVQKTYPSTNDGSVTIYTNPSFMAQSRGQAYTGYFAGTVTTETSKQLAQAETGGHSPWKASPIDVAVYGTQNFAPNGTQQMSETAKQFVGTYNGTKVTYTLTSSTKQTATVIEKGLPYGLTVHLYKPVHHRYWLIDQVTLDSSAIK